MNIQRNKNRKLVMNLEQALLQYGNDINYIILRDGTNIEIIDEFIEEKFEENNYGYDNYMYKEIDPNGTLRGKGLKKSLRKTVLKSINNQEKLRSTNSNNIDNNKVIIKQTEDNEYLQCANCFRFFNSKEDVPKQAYSMGIKSIMQARQILLIASGKNKADALYDSILGPITPSVPASILQLHNNVTIVADVEALSKILENHTITPGGHLL